jgi:MarR family transcriptional regulator, temperature-dependent positive regulator of motility
MHRNLIQDVNPIPVAYRISLLANLFTGGVYRQVAAQHGVARSEFVVVFCLRMLGELTAQDIVDITGRPKNSISRSVNAMLERGFVARRVDPDNARRSPLTLTRTGKALYDDVLPLFQAREAAMLAVLTARERETLNKLLAKLAVRDDGWEIVAVGDDA